MAFPVPQHLPRAGPLADIHDTSSKTQISVAQTILREIAKPLTNLTPALARKCVHELDQALIDTRKQLHSHIEKDSAAFDRQRQSAVDISRQAAQLDTEVKHLDKVLNGAQDGLMPNLLQRLASHSRIAQLFQDASSRAKALETFLTCFVQLEDILEKTRQGDLPEAAQLCRTLSSLLSESEAEGLFRGSKLWTNLTGQYRATDDNIQEQLGKAYHSGVHVNVSSKVTTIQVQQTVKLPVWVKPLQLSAIVSAMRGGTVAAIASSLRKDIMARLVGPILISYASISINGDALSINSGNEEIGNVLPNLERVLTFLQKNIPAAIMATLHLDVSSSILKHLLVPSLPQSLPALPPFLGLLRQAVQLEQKFDDVYDIKEWADDVGLHYERARRQALLDHARTIVLDGDKVYFEVEDLTESPKSVLDSVALESTPSARVAGSTADEGEDDESTWDFEDPPSSKQEEPARTAQSGPVEDVDDETWGFDEPATAAPVKTDVSEPDGPGWGWDDEVKDEQAADDDDDDPWDQPKPAPKRNGASAPRAASRLERIANRGRQPSVAEARAAQSRPIRSVRSGTQSAPRPTPAKSEPPRAAPEPGKQTFTVSQRAQAVLHVAEICLEESKQLLAHKDIPKRHPPTGTLMMATPSSVFELYRALPQEDIASPRYVIVSNDCKYLSKEVARLAQPLISQNDVTKFPETINMLETASARALISSIAQQIGRIGEALAPAAGFAKASDDAHAAQCHRAVESVLSRCQNLRNEWQPLMTFSTYTRAMGAVVDSALHGMMDAILRLPDITESESHGLSSLCIMMQHVEELFIRSPGMNSEIALYVPSWFKFNYLSTLLEASMADFTEFFREGMLVDFDVQEIASLLRALFADTPLRAQTIDLVLAGQPAALRA
ncbi:hypothetical protein CALVIDRAFT_551874 [Calocera viscosa TUFC12733]|uniref:ZW10 C-terminal helical domain-containing protein n=1 Tax=Calocera viscosa (strain TUFC12733) TaxID=1330018 RepID=A0A167S0L1_CALVF|nr:hypothetical protein CALVIDRAFT_551874 [Calocera viscosa TUFC12733]